MTGHSQSSAAKTQLAFKGQNLYEEKSPGSMPPTLPAQVTSAVRKSEDKSPQKSVVTPKQFAISALKSDKSKSSRP